MGKEIYVIPHRIGQSNATNRLLEQEDAKAIYNIDNFISKFSNIKEKKYNNFLEFCKTNPTYEEALNKFPNKVFEAELSAEIEIKHGKIFLL